MPTPALLLLIATLLPLGSFLALWAAGRRMGHPLAGLVGTSVCMASFALSLAALIAWLDGGMYAGVDWGAGTAPVMLRYPWLPVGPGIDQKFAGYLTVGLYVDSLTVVLFGVITCVSTLVHVFSLAYIRKEPRYGLYFTYLSLFTFAMLALVIAGTLIQIFVFWELVGFCSWCLIGYWYERRDARRAAIKAFLVNRVGDAGLLIALVMLVMLLGNVSLPTLWAVLGNAGAGVEQALPGGGFAGLSSVSPLMMTVIGLCLFAGAMGKGAQFPLHGWLPDAMTGPTPASALIHAATMVAAGVYLMARVFPLLTPDAKVVIAIVGAVTAAVGALCALAQSDIKRLLAYSTISQLGLMVLAIGVGSWTGAVFHLCTHAFFKSLLFLGAGNVLSANHHHNDMNDMGGMFRHTPVTAICTAIAAASMAGIPFTSGYYSKELILGHAVALAHHAQDTGRAAAWWLLAIVPAGVAYITAFYMARWWALVFLSSPRKPELLDRPRELPVTWLPLIVLALLSVVAGLPGTPMKQLIDSSRMEASAVAGGPTFQGFVTAWPAESRRTLTLLPVTLGEAAPDAEHGGPAIVERGMQTAHSATWLAAPLGLIAGLLLYARGPRLVGRFTGRGPLGLISRWLRAGMYIDGLLGWVIVRPVMAAARLARGVDRVLFDGPVNLAGALTRGGATMAGLVERWVIDGAVHSVARGAWAAAAAVRNPASGRVRLYIALLIAAVAAACLTLVLLTGVYGST